MYNCDYIILKPKIKYYNNIHLINIDALAYSDKANEGKKNFNTNTH